MKHYLSLIVLLPSLACAGEFWGSTTLGSFHTKRYQNLREQNYGLGIEYHESRQVLYLAGSYINSHDRRTVYALAGWTPIDFGAIKVGMMAGVANGYPKMNNGRITPALAGLVRIEYEKLGMNLTLIPPRYKESPVTLGLQLKFGF